MTHIGGDPLGIPENWTFNDADIASKFDSHVRGQLPWYDFASDITCELARGFIPDNGVVYDMGAATGNIGFRLTKTIMDREAKLIGIEPSAEMIKNQGLRARSYAEMIEGRLENIALEPFDVGICFLTAMFIPTSRRKRAIDYIFGKVKPGGAMIMVERFENPYPYLNTLFNRIGWRMKTNANTNNDIVEKELSLSGIQRPLSFDELPTGGVRYFQSGDFIGTVWTK